MREIKFRFFDKLKNDTFTINDMNSYEVWDCVQDDRYITMRFTGLTDKYGVDIYEGDILAFATGLKFQRGCVVFSKGGFKFDINKPFFAKRTHVSEAINRKGAKARIIGNIYENPELLEK